MTQAEILTELASLDVRRAELLAELVALTTRREEDRLLTVQEAAEVLNVTTDWLYRHADSLPFTVRPGPGMLRFSHRRLQEYLRG